MAQKVVIVGAGPGGLISMANFQHNFSRDDIEIVCYERRDQLGGEWIDMKDQPETYDKLGLPMRTSMYDELQMNSPQLIYPPHPDYKFPPGTKLYPSMTDMFNYLKAIASDNKLEQYIKFNKMVSDISFDKETSTFSMKVHDLKSEDVKDETSDYVLLCNGKEGLPRKPDIDMSKFTGEWFHYHDLRDPKRMYGKRILVVGGFLGAMDIVAILNKPGRARSMHLCYRSVPPLFEGSANLSSIHQCLTSAEGNTVTFKDGSSVGVDAVIFCTGFAPCYPLADDLKLNFEENALSKYLVPLFKSFVHPRCPKLFFLGKAHFGGLCASHPQSLLISKIIKGEFTLPSQKEMESDIERFLLHWGSELMRAPSHEDMKSNLPLCELELYIAGCYHEMCPDVPRAGGDFIREVFYELLRCTIEDCLNFKSYVNEFRPDPKNPKRMIPHFKPPNDSAPDFK